MVDDTNFDKEFIMQKFSFRVDIVNDGHVDTNSVIDAISGVVDGEGKHFAVVFTGDETLSDQGLKVWAKRVAGISLAAPKTKKAKPAVSTETAETVA
jgi:hypothetical protein